MIFSAPIRDAQLKLLVNISIIINNKTSMAVGLLLRSFIADFDFSQILPAIFLFYSLGRYHSIDIFLGLIVSFHVNERHICPIRSFGTDIHSILLYKVLILNYLKYYCPIFENIFKTLTYTLIPFYVSCQQINQLMIKTYNNKI